MIKRVTLLWKHAHLDDVEFKALWLGEHAMLATQLKGLREYTIDFVCEEAPGRPDGIAVLRFDDRAALEAAFADGPFVERLLKTRATFAERVDVFLVEETPIFCCAEGSPR